MISPARNSTRDITPIPITNRICLRPPEAADSMGVSLRTVMAWVQAGEIPVVRLGDRCLRIPVDGLRAWLASRTTWPTAMVIDAEAQAEEVTR